MIYGCIDWGQGDRAVKSQGGTHRAGASLSCSYSVGLRLNTCIMFHVETLNPGSGDLIMQCFSL